MSLTVRDEENKFSVQVVLNTISHRYIFALPLHAHVPEFYQVSQRKQGSIPATQGTTHFNFVVRGLRTDLPKLTPLQDYRLASLRTESNTGEPMRWQSSLFPTLRANNLQHTHPRKRIPVPMKTTTCSGPLSVLPFEADKQGWSPIGRTRNFPESAT